MEYKHLPEEIKAKPYKTDPNYEYIECKFSQVLITLLQEIQKMFNDLDNEDPRKQKVIEVVYYMDQLSNEGWELCELAYPITKVYELRRYRRLKKES